MRSLIACLAALIMQSAVIAPSSVAQAVEGGMVPTLDPAKLSGPTRLCGWWDNPTRFNDAKALSPGVCRADPALKKSGFK